MFSYSLFQRKNGELDKESLSLSEQVLGANPDFSTLWNFRREIFLQMKDEKYVLKTKLFLAQCCDQNYLNAHL